MFHTTFDVFRKLPVSWLPYCGYPLLDSAKTQTPKTNNSSKPEKKSGCDGMGTTLEDFTKLLLSYKRMAWTLKGSGKKVVNIWEKCWKNWAGIPRHFEPFVLIQPR